MSAQISYWRNMVLRRYREILTDSGDRPGMRLEILADSGDRPGLRLEILADSGDRPGMRLDILTNSGDRPGMRLDILTNSGAVPVTDPEQGAQLTDLIPVQAPDYAGSNLILARDT